MLIMHPFAGFILDVDVYLLFSPFNFSSVSLSDSLFSSVTTIKEKG